MNTIEDVILMVGAQKSEGKTVVFTNGCFDILHVGHIVYLQQARNMGDFLVVGLNSDSSVSALKGPSRPINSQEDRHCVLSALKMVDVVVVFNEGTPISLIKMLKPDIHVKGGDYTPETLPEYGVVTGYGGRVETVSFVPQKSTSRLIEVIQSL